jgi:hypothetical protein
LVGSFDIAAQSGLELAKPEVLHLATQVPRLDVRLVMPSILVGIAYSLPESTSMQSASSASFSTTCLQQGTVRRATSILVKPPTLPIKTSIGLRIKGI